MVRFGTPMFDSDGKKRGVVLLNYLGKDLINKLKMSSVGLPGNIMLLNSDGFWLYGGKPEDEWAFMYEDRSERTFGNAFPDAWRRISADDKGHFHDANSLFTFDTVYPLKEGWVSANGNINPSGDSTKRVDAKEYKWKIVSHVTPNIFSSRLTWAYNLIFLICGTIIVFAGIGSWFLASTSTKKRIAEQKLHEAAEQINASLREKEVLLHEFRPFGTI